MTLPSDKRKAHPEENQDVTVFPDSSDSPDSQAPTRHAPADPQDQHATLGLQSRNEHPFDQTLALPSDSVEHDAAAPDTCHLPPPSIDRPTEHATVHDAPVSAVPAPEQPFDQTLALPGDGSVSAPSRPLDRTEQLTEPGATRPDAVPDQTLNDESLPSLAPTEAGQGDASAATRPGSPTAAVRRAAQGHDTSPLSTGGEHTAPPTRHGQEARRPTDVPSMAKTVPMGGDPGSRLPAVPGYQLLGELGRGGMGVVYKARQLKLNRIVALKMIRSATHASGDDLRRFRVEAEAVAALQHPNIVQIYEIGEVDDLPFFSLEYIDGGSLHQKLDKNTTLPARQVAELIETLARAVHHAHQRGIVHRDLKPANILLAGGAPVLETGGSRPPLVAATAKITDFGLAKHLDKDTGQTREGSILGTPSYMAPEQAEGKNNKIGPAADIYALGSILYDLLASRPPFRGETLMDTLHQVINVEPLPPTRLQPNLSRELETICLKCLQKDPKNRYLTAGALADDLRHFLNGEPISARATPWWEKAAKWARRRPAIASMILFGFLLIAGLTSGSLIYAGQQRRNAELQEKQIITERELAKAEGEKREQAEQLMNAEIGRAKAESEKREQAEKQARVEKNLKDIAEERRGEADRERRRADLRARDALEAVDRLLTQVADEQLEHIPQLQPMRKRLYAGAREFLERFYRNNRNDPLLREQLAFAQRRMGFIFEKLGDPDKSVEAYAEALTLSRALDRNNLENLRNTAIIADKLAIVLQDRKKVEAAEKLFDEAVATLQGVKERYPDPSVRPALLAGLVASPLQPAGQRWNTVWDLLAVQTWNLETEKVVYSLADAHLHRGNLRQVQNRIPLAREDFTQAVALFGPLHRLAPNEPVYQWRLGVAHSSLAVNLFGKDAVSSLQELDRAIALLGPLAKQHERVAAYRADLALGHRYRGTMRFISAPPADAGEKAREQAEEDLVRSADLFDALAAEYESVPEYQLQRIESRNSLGIYFRETKKKARCVKAWRDAITAIEKVPAGLRDSIDHQKRKAAFQLELATALLMAPTPAIEEAVEVLQQSIDLVAGMIKKQPEARDLWARLISRHATRVAMWKQQGRMAEVVRDYAPLVKAHEERCKQFGNMLEDVRDLAAALRNWSVAERERSLTDEADHHLKQAMKLQRGLIQANPDNPRWRYDLCVSLLDTSDHKAVREAVRDWESKLNEDKAALQEAGWFLSRCVPLAGDKGLADNYAAEAVRLLKKAAEHGFRVPVFLQKKEFDVLRMRSDFAEVTRLMQMKK